IKNILFQTEFIHYEDYLEKDAVVFLIETFYMAIDRLNSMALIPGIRFEGEVVVLTKNKPIQQQLSKFTKLVSMQNTNQSKLLGVVDATQEKISEKSTNILSEYNIPILKSMIISASDFATSNYSLHARTYNTFATLMKPITAVLQQMKWHQVQYVNTVDSVANEFVSEMNKSHIQTDKTYSFYNLYLEEVISSASCDHIADALIKNSNTSVIVLMVDGKLEKCLLESVHKKSVKTKFHWVSAYYNEKRNYTGVESTANGLLSLYYQPMSNVTEIIAEHVKSINVEGNTRNPLCHEHFSQSISEITTNTANSTSVHLCSVDKFREFTMLNDLYVGIADAVYAYVFAFKDVVSKVCGSNSNYCEEAKNVSAEQFFNKYLMKVVFTDITGKQEVAFYNKERKFRVEVEQFKKHVGKYERVKVGDYNEPRLTFDKNRVCLENIPSTCYPTCKNGYRKVENPLNICCWICEKCGSNEIVVNNTECMSCKFGEVPNKNQTACRAIDLIDIFANLSSTLQRIEGKFTDLEKRMKTLEDTKCNH
ncbi:metabotropic glutamate receptor B precursor-like protein, partial [Leptotrombidium deliense]